ncbi:phage antirepressor KilAC domain-containing protein [Rhodovulum sp. PH10]|uniref:phage antirepressor KilAC domain-containing protein n=1 Tax=Rhodovulum sp. PH10 TaxID=1187851 RepID=UPI00058D6970|nr:phage antirepressor KilAC domain-containing protein [Rhodovulum sp. PH10]
MNEINPFQFEGRNVRLIDLTGETWFVATDVARELGYRDAADLVRTLDADEKGTHNLRTLGGEQEVAIISEPGLYRAIIQRRANKKHDHSLTEKIGRFQRWVFHDILPSIRKTGGYGEADPMKALADPAALRGLLLTYSEKVLALEGEVAELRPQTDALDRIATSDGSLCITDAAKTLQVRPKDLFTFLRRNGWIYARPGGSQEVAYQSRLVSGDLEHKTTTVTRSDGSEKTVTQVRVTPRGLTKLAKILPPVASRVA